MCIAPALARPDWDGVGIRISMYGYTGSDQN